MAKVLKFENTQWGLVGSVANGFSILSPTAPALQINQELNGLWIGGNSDADAVYIRSANFGQTANPILVSVGVPFVGNLKPPIDVWPATFCGLTPNEYHRLQLFGVEAPDELEFYPLKRGPKRDFERLNFPLNPGTQQSEYQAVFGRQYMGYHVKNEGGAAINVTVQGLIAGDNTLTPTAPFPTMQAYGNAINIGAGAEKFIPVTLGLTGGNGQAIAPVSFVNLLVASTGAAGQASIYFEAMDW